jgi:hypothetical protein
VTTIRYRLRRRLRNPDVDGFDRESGQEAAANPAIPVNVDDDQPTKIEASRHPVAATHIPDAAASFDPWGIRTSTS